MDDEDDMDDERDTRVRPFLPLLPRGPWTYGFLRALLTATATITTTATARMTPNTMAPPSFPSPEATPRGRLPGHRVSHGDREMPGPPTGQSRVEELLRVST
ncbi:hypothetical protein ACGFYV_25065 [Streptomyces sp. NPDC048297]|uniref:hypothetical protein n=1 Tax=Streptomyces sp. NPDC048297 TaxID=3365531 RepID=UPI003720658C